MVTGSCRRRDDYHHEPSFIRHRPFARSGAAEGELTGCVPIARTKLVVTVRGMSYPSDLTGDQWDVLEPVFNAPGKRGRKHADDLRTVVNAMLYIAQTGCQWRYLPASFGPWTRVWSQFRRWSRNGTWAEALTVLHAVARQADGRAEETPSMVVIDTHWPAVPRTVASPSTTAEARAAAPRAPSAW